MQIYKNDNDTYQACHGNVVNKYKLLPPITTERYFCSINILMLHLWKKIPLTEKDLQDTVKHDL